MVDGELVVRKMALILEDLRAVTPIAQKALDAYLASRLDEIVTERYLERMIGRMIDINYHLITDAGHAPPRDYYASFTELAKLRILPPAFASQIATCAGLRNRLVHEYDEIDPRASPRGAAGRRPRHPRIPPARPHLRRGRCLVGETRVDLLHLLEDLRDAYPGATEETILTEIVANALDSGAASLTITTDATAPALTLADDGVGMRRRELARYHDIASSTKVRGDGIGFAGVGIKIALLVCAEVVTETRRGKHHVASAWRLASRHKAPWRWIPPPGLVGAQGTAVRLIPTNALSPLVDAGFVEGALRRNFQPLFDPALADALKAQYPRGVTFTINGHGLEPHAWRAQDVAPIAIRVARKRKPAGAGYLTRDAGPLPEELRGVAVSTFGKVIKRGWDWLGIASPSLERVGGLMEVPALAECLTLNKADFIRAGTRGATYLAYRKAIQEAVSRQLAEWGQAAEPDERARRRAARPVERDLETVLADLADDFPLLASLVEQRMGGQRRLPVARADAAPDDDGALLAMRAAGLAPGDAPADESPEAEPRESAPGSGDSSPDDTRTETDPPPAPAASGRLAVGPRVRRPARYGLNIQFEERPDDVELGRLIESTVWVNEGHPAYRRAAASRSEGYHVAVAVAMALAPLAVDPAKEHGFVTAFLTSWGAAVDRRAARRR